VVCVCLMGVVLMIWCFWWLLFVYDVLGKSDVLGSVVFV